MRIEVNLFVKIKFTFVSLSLSQQTEHFITMQPYCVLSILQRPLVAQWCTIGSHWDFGEYFSNNIQQTRCVFYCQNTDSEFL